MAATIISVRGALMGAAMASSGLASSANQSTLITNTGVMSAAEDNSLTGATGLIATQVLPVAIAAYSPTLYYSNAPTGAKDFIKASAGNLRSIHVINKNAAVRYLMFANTTDGTMTGTIVATFLIPVDTAVLPGALTLGEDFFSKAGINFTVGISYGISVQTGTFSAATNTDHAVVATFK